MNWARVLDGYDHRLRQAIGGVGSGIGRHAVRPSKQYVGGLIDAVPIAFARWGQISLIAEVLT